MSRPIFLDKHGKLHTQRIAQTDIRETVAWLDMMFPELELLDNMVGSTGIKPTSSNIDLVVDTSKVKLDQIFDYLIHWAHGNKMKPSLYVKSGSNIVFFRCPITGRPESGFVQVNFYPTSDLAYSRFMMTCSPKSEHKCRERNVLLNSIAYALGYRLNPLAGLYSLDDGRLVSRNPDRIAKILLSPTATEKDLLSVESVLQSITYDFNRESKTAKFRQHIEKEGIPIMESKEETESYFLSRLRDRIVNQGMQPLFEASARIEHLEDLVFEKGSRGVQEAIDIINHTSQDTKKTATIKFDGKPAIIWGRKPTGEFVLTDKSGFKAKGYDGLSTSPQQIADIMNSRGENRGELIGIYAKLFPLLEAATPENFKGYVQGDLLYSNTPPEVKGAYVFKPNFIEYKIPANSKLGQQIGVSDVGIAVHTRIKNREEPVEEPIGGTQFNEVPGLLLIKPTLDNAENIQLNQAVYKNIVSLLNQHGRQIDQLFNPSDLRAQKITDLPQLCKKFINSRITSNFDDLLPGFMTWLETNVTPGKYSRIVEYLQSPSSNADGISAAFAIFLLLHELKMDVLNQLDRQQPGQEGWVLASPAGRAKLVDRFGFSVGNRQMNNPTN